MDELKKKHEEWEAKKKTLMKSAFEKLTPDERRALGLRH
jgi:hypothetical protein